VGVRDVDSHEKENIRKAGVEVFTMRDIDERGMRTVIQQAIHAVSSGTSGFHLSFDLDAVDPDEAPGVGTPVHGGITYREAHLAMEKIAESGGMRSLEVVEINTALDVNNRTAELGVELILSALGKTIL
jgi:arginase